MTAMQFSGSRGAWLFIVFVIIFSFTHVLYTRVGTQGRVYADAASTLNFQARLLNGNGSVVADGNYSVEFKLYAAETGGSSVWDETKTVAVRGGYLSVYLGSSDPFDAGIDWSQTHWLTMNVNSDGEMDPRLRLTAVPFAFRAAQAGALTNGSGTLAAGDLLHKAPGSAQTVNSSNPGLWFNQTGGGGLLQLQGDGADVFTVSKAGAGYLKGSLDIDGSSLNIGAAATAGGLVLHDGSNHTGTIETAALGQNTIFTLPDPGSGTATICLSIGNCSGSGDIINGGNSTGDTVVIGTNDTEDLMFETDGDNRLTITSGGLVEVAGAFEVNGLTTLNGGASIGNLDSGLDAVLPYTITDALLYIDESFTTYIGENEPKIGQSIAIDVDPGANGSETIGQHVFVASNPLNINDIDELRGLYTQTAHLGDGNVAIIQGHNAVTNIVGAGTVGLAQGIVSTIQSGGSGLVSDLGSFDGQALAHAGLVGEMYAYNGGLTINDADVGNTYGLRLATTITGTGSIEDAFGVYINDHTGLGTVSSYNLYSAGDGLNYFGGNVGIGTDAADEALHVIGGACIEATDTDCNVGNGSLLLGEGLYFSNSTSHSIAVNATSSGNGQQLTINSGATSDNAASGGLTLIGGGTHNGNGNGGTLELNGGLALGSGAGGNVYIYGGQSVSGTNGNTILAYSPHPISGGVKGKVGIGTSGTPSQLLSIGGTTGNLTIDASGSIVTAGSASIAGGLDNNSGGITEAGSITGVGANLTASAGLTIASGGSGDLAIDSATNKLVIAANDTTLQRTASGSYTIDLSDTSATTLRLTNSGTGVADLNLVDGGLQVGGLAVLTNGGALQNLTGLTVASGGASITGGLTATGVIAINNNSSNTLGLNTGSSSGQITIGGGSAPLVINSTNFDVDSLGGLSGITGYAQASGNFAVSGTGTFSTGSGLVSLNGATSISTSSNSTIALTVNGTSGTAATALQITQTGNAANVAMTNTARTSGALISLSHSTSAFTGTGLEINIASGSGSFASGKFLDFKVNGATRVQIANTGALQINSDATAALEVRNSSGTTSFFTVNTSGNFVQVGSSTPDSTAISFILDSKNDNATDPTGVAGAMYYNSFVQRFRCYQDGLWRDCVSSMITKTVSTTVTRNANTFIDVTDLTFAVAANTKYQLKCSLTYQSTATGTGIKIAVNGPASPASVGLQHTSVVAANGDMIGVTVRAYDTVVPATGTGAAAVANTDIPSVFDGYFQTGATAGDLVIRLASETANQVQINAGSSCQLTPQ